MSTENDVQQFNMRISATRLAMVDAIRAREPGVPTRPEMIRRLIDRAFNEYMEHAAHGKDDRRQLAG